MLIPSLLALALAATSLAARQRHALRSPADHWADSLKMDRRSIIDGQSSGNPDVQRDNTPARLPLKAGALLPQPRKMKSTNAGTAIQSTTTVSTVVTRTIFTTLFVSPTSSAVSISNSSAVLNATASVTFSNATSTGFSTALRSTATPFAFTCINTIDDGGACSPSTGDCCSTGATCRSGTCVRYCTLASLEQYCDAVSPCATNLGYTCVNSRCSIPVGAVHVNNGLACDGVKTFCTPFAGVCVNSVCAACTLSA